MRLRLKLAALVFAAVTMLALSACGLPAPLTPAPAVHHAAPTFAQVVQSHQCPPGKSFMGCATPAPARPSTAFSSPSGARFPDVSVFQGAVNWPAVKAWQVSHGWRPAEIFKMGEFTTDRFASRNSSIPASLGFWRAGYWFVRNTGCSHELAQILAAAHTYRLKVVALDLEVPEARGYGQCLSPGLKHAGLIVVEYTSPGSNPGGVDTSDPLWEATFGSSFSPIWHPVVAWQCSDGVFGCVTDIPGIGRDDVSVDLGITRLGGAPPPPPDPYRIFLKRVILVAGIHLSEYDTAQHFDKLHCRGNPRPVRAVCRQGRAHLVLLRDRDIYLAHHPLVHGHATYGFADRGLRVHGFQIRVWRSHG